MPRATAGLIHCLGINPPNHACSRMRWGESVSLESQNEKSIKTTAGIDFSSPMDPLLWGFLLVPPRMKTHSRNRLYLKKKHPSTWTDSFSSEFFSNISLVLFYHKPKCSIIYRWILFKKSLHSSSTQLFLASKKFQHEPWKLEAFLPPTRTLATRVTKRRTQLDISMAWRMFSEHTPGKVSFQMAWNTMVYYNPYIPE